MKSTFLMISALSAVFPIPAFAAPPSFIGPLNSITDAASTVPANGDVNPYSVAVVPTNTGNLISVNSGDGNMVETTPQGKQISVKAVDVTNTGAGTLFGLAIGPDRPAVYFVNDGNNTLSLLH